MPKSVVAYRNIRWSVKWEIKLPVIYRFGKCMFEELICFRHEKSKSFYLTTRQIADNMFQNAAVTTGRSVIILLFLMADYHSPFSICTTKKDPLTVVAGRGRIYNDPLE